MAQQLNIIDYSNSFLHNFYLVNRLLQEILFVLYIKDTMSYRYKRTLILLFVLMKIKYSFSFPDFKNEILFHVCSTNGKQSSSYLQRTTLRKIKVYIAVKENFFQTRNSWNISNSVTSNLIFRRRVIMRTKIPNFL